MLLSPSFLSLASVASVLLLNARNVAAQFDQYEWAQDGIMPLGGFMIIPPSASSAPIPNAKFVFTQSGYLKVQIPTGNGNLDVHSMRLITGTVPKPTDDISLSFTPTGYIELYNKGAQSIISTALRDTDGEDRQPFTGRFEYDRRFRVRNGAGNMVWSFPSKKTNNTFLDSQGINYIGEGDILRSNNNLWWITFNPNGVLRTNNNYALNRASNIPFEPRVLSVSNYGTIDTHSFNGQARNTQLTRLTGSRESSQFILQIEDDGKIVLIDAGMDTSTLIFDIATVGPAGPPSGWDSTVPWPPAPPVISTTTTTTTTPPSPTPTAPVFNTKALWSDTNPIMKKGQFIVSPNGSFKFGVGQDGYVQIVKDSSVLRRFASSIIDQSTVAGTEFSLTLDTTCRLIHSSGSTIIGTIFDPVSSLSHKQLSINDDGLVICSDKVSGQRMQETGYKIFKLSSGTPLNYMYAGEAVFSDSSISNLRLEQRSLVLTCNGRTRRIIPFSEDASRLVLEKDGSVNVYSNGGRSIWSPPIEADGSKTHVLETLDECQTVSSRTDKSASFIVLADDDMPTGLTYTKIFQIVKGSCLALKYGNVIGSKLTTESCRENALQRWAFDSNSKLHPESNPELCAGLGAGGNNDLVLKPCAEGVSLRINTDDATIRFADNRKLDDYGPVGNGVYPYNGGENRNHRWSTEASHVVPPNLTYYKYKTQLSNGFLSTTTFNDRGWLVAVPEENNDRKFFAIDVTGRMRSKEDPSMCVSADPPESAQPWNLYLRTCMRSGVKVWTYVDNLLQTQPLGCINWKDQAGDQNKVTMWSCGRDAGSTLWDRFA
ncbi:hypothetical protein HDU67_005446 [Dinochytrium kinnereticum]|nr:hypothetical protein HDU67_005446 [Dinochytrium kinnereticum]